MFNLQSLKNLGKRKRIITSGHSRKKRKYTGINPYNELNKFNKYKDFKLGLWFIAHYPSRVEVDD
jgi:hypothetical protein